MCYVLLNTKSFRCGATTGQVPVPVGTVDTRPVRPGAISTTQPRQCRYMKRLVREHRSYCIEYRRRYPGPPAGFWEWLRDVRMSQACEVQVYVSIQKNIYDCRMDDLGRNDCHKFGVAHTYPHAPGTPVALLVIGETPFENRIPESLKLSLYAGTPLGTLGRIMSRVSNHQAPNLGSLLESYSVGKSAWEGLGFGGPKPFLSWSEPDSTASLRPSPTTFNKGFKLQLRKLASYKSTPDGSSKVTGAGLFPPTNIDPHIKKENNPQCRTFSYINLYRQPLEMRFSTRSSTADMYPRPITFITFQVLVVGFGVASILAAPTPIRGPNDSGLTSETDTLDTLRSRQSAPPLSHFFEPSPSITRLSDDSADLSRHIDNPMDVDSGSNFFNGARGRSEQDSFSERTVLWGASIPDQAEYVDDDDPESVQGRGVEDGQSFETTTTKVLLHSRADRLAEIKTQRFKKLVPDVRDPEDREAAYFILEWAKKEVRVLRGEQQKNRRKDLQYNPQPQARPEPKPKSTIDLAKLRTTLEYLIQDPNNPHARRTLETLYKQAQEVKKRLEEEWRSQRRQQSETQAETPAETPAETQAEAQAQTPQSKGKEGCCVSSVSGGATTARPFELARAFPLVVRLSGPPTAKLQYPLNLEALRVLFLRVPSTGDGASMSLSLEYTGFTNSQTTKLVWPAIAFGRMVLVLDTIIASRGRPIQSALLYGICASKQLHSGNPALDEPEVLRVRELHSI
ncbi:hypothetical protein EV360DRAFT_70426 [Lentinula raphanica]|nr:hypothetical protein EV360DRAFT_70426 [Lentinula raphanica]